MTLSVIGGRTAILILLLSDEHKPEIVLLLNHVVVVSGPGL